MLNDTGPANGEFPFQVLNPNKHRESRERRWLDARLKEGQRQPVSDIHPLTPELADLLLRANPDNRNIKESNLAACMSDLQSERWQFNGESIVVSKEGFLNDGQHRCLAVIQTGTTVPQQLFCFGVERDSRTTVDSGSSRTAGDYLSMDGVSQANHRAAVASMLIQIERHGRPITTAVHKPTKQEIIERCRADEAIAASVRAAHKTQARKLASITVLGAAHYLFSQVSSSQADFFIQKLITGDELKTKDPILRLRNKLLDRQLRLNKAEQLKAIINAWNFWRRGKSAIGAGSLVHTIQKGEKLPGIL